MKVRELIEFLQSVNNPEAEVLLNVDGSIFPIDKEQTNETLTNALDPAELFIVASMEWNDIGWDEPMDEEEV